MVKNEKSLMQCKLLPKVFKSIMFRRKDMDKWGVLVLPYGWMVEVKEEQTAKRLVRILDNALGILKNENT